MIIDQSLKNNIKIRSNDFLFNNLEKAIDELNFKDGMSGSYGNCEDKTGYIYIEIEFDNSWVLKVWRTGTYSLWLDDTENIHILNCGFDELLKFMEKQGIRKPIQCEYKDSELFIVNFTK